MDSELFDISVVIDRFKKASTSEDDVLLEHYIEAFKEILKFFNAMGSIFGFVSSDIKTKIGIIEEFRLNKEVSDKFLSVKSMMDYEMSAELLQKKDYVSGCRTLLRLHRGLDFTRNFLRKLAELNPDDKTSDACKVSYQDTLAPYHPFLIRKGANLAMYALPTRDVLLTKVCKDVSLSVKALPEMLQYTDTVYDRIQALYKLNDLLALP
ncbi:ceramide-1-phosphate transfer protein [Chironomus tepperi]|uniref:ceramide-1-phosphate transfer protein n=1 Tax=Chironomus tepperi TaxID=113505 RepID=UPI00391F526B